MEHNIIAHIIGMDDIHKAKLIKAFPSNIGVIDLDVIQQHIHNNKEVIKQKLIWGNISQEIIMMRKQTKLIGSKKKKQPALQNKIKKFLLKRNQIKKKIHKIWQTMMNANIQSQLIKNQNKQILFMGHNIFPKDYRIKINLNLSTGKKLMNPEGLSMSRNNSINNTPNKIVYNMKPQIYAANQIKYYLNTYSHKIIKGTFPLNLLKTEYLSEKYKKILNHYFKQDYQIVDQTEIMTTISALIHEHTLKNNIKGKDLYIATLYKTNGIIPVNKNKPVQVYQSKSDAIKAIKNNIKNNKPIYLHKIKSQEIAIDGNKMYATKVIYPIDEESLLITDI